MNRVIGELLNEIRIKRGYTHQQLSDISGIPIGTVKSILSGATPNPGYINVCALLFAMGESSDDFFCTLTDRVPTEKVPPMPEVIPDHTHPKPLQADDLHNAAADAIKKALTDDYVTNLKAERAWWRSAFFAASAVVVFLAASEMLLI